MRAVTLLPRLSMFRRVFVFALALVAGCFAASAQQTTTFQGTVYSPFGPTAGTNAYAGDPIPNILVFVQDTVSGNGGLPTFTTGVNIPSSGQSGCDAQQNLVPRSLLGSALTGVDGTFSFPITASPLPDPVNIVIQAGKWRRVYSFPASMFTLGGLNQGLKLSMPSAQEALTTMPSGGGPIQADLPHIAVVTGSADNVECIFSQIGIASTEITDVGGTGSINLFEGVGSGGSVASTTKPAPTEMQLLNPSITTATPVPITNYDLVIFGCQGGYSTDTAAFGTNAATTASVLTNYTSDGGRILLTHYQYPLLEAAFPSIATWTNGNSNPSSSGDVTGVLNSGYSGYSTLEGWMNDIGALTSTNPPSFALPNGRRDLKTLASAADVWANVPTYASYGDPAIQFSFNTPLGASGTPAITVVFTNNTTTFVRGDTNDSITVNVTNTGTIATSGATLTLTLQLPTAITNPVFTDSTGGWTCSAAGTVATCSHPTSLAAGASDPVTMTFGILGTATPGQVTVTATISGGNINSSEQCGRVLFNDYHVEGSATKGSVYSGSSCLKSAGNGLSSAQKFLEYSLYALSNFISPSTTDVFTIAATPDITWTTTSPYYYGTPAATIESASADVAGSFVYTVTPTPAMLVSPFWDAATYKIEADFTPTDTTDYTTASQTATVQILPDPTYGGISNLVNPIYYGQEIGYDPVAGDASLNINVPVGYPLASANSGTFTATIDGVLVCTGTPGDITGGSRPNACPDAGFLGWNAGPHVFQLNYPGDVDFLAMTPYDVTVQVNPDPTTTTVSSSNANVVVHSNVTFTAAVTNAYATTLGAVAFYDSPVAVTAQAGSVLTPNVVPSPAGATLIGTGALAANGTASASLTTLTVGTHYIVACLVGAQNTSGTYNFQDSCSGSIAQVIVVPPPVPEGTQTLLVTSQNPSAVGQAVSFTATVKSTGALVAVPTGTVSFTSDGGSLGTGTLDANGTAVVTTSSLALGTHAIVATYAGSTTMATSVSSTLSQVVEDPLTAAGTGFVMNITPSPTVDVGVGGSTVVTIQIVDLTNFSQQVQLACTGLPSQSQCLFAQSLVPAGGGTTQMLVTASAPHNCNSTAQYFTSGLGGFGWPMFGLGMLTLCVARKRRKLQAVALTLMLVAVPSVLSGCGGGNCTDFGVKPGDYSFTITGTSKGSPSVVKSQTLTMHVHL